jgi:hypothetical protein
MSVGSSNKDTFKFIWWRLEWMEWIDSDVLVSWENLENNFL